MKAGQAAEQSLANILQAREERVHYQRRLLEVHQSSLISFKLNIPGSMKDSDTYQAIFREGMKAVLFALEEDECNVLDQCEVYKASGPEGFIVVDASPERLKETMVRLEESHVLGRIFDLDVLAKDGTQVSRNSLGFEPRKCFLCAEDAFVCARSRQHTLREMLEYIAQVWSQFSEKSERDL